MSLIPKNKATKASWHELVDEAIRTANDPASWQCTDPTAPNYLPVAGIVQTKPKAE